MVPCFVYLLHLGQKDAVATSLMAMIGTAIVASTRNFKNGFGDWKIAAVTSVRCDADGLLSLRLVETVQR